MRRLVPIPPQYVAALALAIALGVGIYVLKRSDSGQFAPAATTALHSAQSSSTAASAAANTKSFLNTAERLCAQARAKLAAIPKPPTQDQSSPAAIEYDKSVAAVLDQTTAGLAAVASSVPLTSSLKAAFRVEGQGQKLVDAALRAAEQHDLAHAQQLAHQASALTAPSDAVIRDAGLGICVGP
jgi:hypothetical protein